MIPKLSLVSVLLLLLTKVAMEAATLEELAWMLGAWERRTAAKVSTERWSKVDASVYRGIGLSSTLPDGDVTFREDLILIAVQGEVFYLAKVAHNELPIAFRRVASGPDHASFQNPKHDFPQTITYRLLNETTLEVEVSGSSGNGAKFKLIKTPQAG